MKEQELERFKAKHGGYNPYELKIHQRGFWLGFLCPFLLFTGFMLMCLLMVGMASAVNQTYSGDTYTFESEQFEYYTIVGNQSDLNGMDIIWENGNTTITFNPLYASDNFSIILFNELVKEVPGPSTGGGGGGGGTRVIYRDKYIPEIFEKEVIVKVPGDEVIKINTIDKIVNEFPGWIIGILIVLSIIILILILKILIDQWYSQDLREDKNVNQNKI